VNLIIACRYNCSILLWFVIVNLFLYLLYEFNPRAPYCPWSQTSLGGLGTYPVWMKGTTMYTEGGTHSPCYQ
jgi:hypothetical protein